TVSIETGRPDQGDIADLAGEWNAEVGESHGGSELLDVVILSGTHVPADGDVEWYQPGSTGSSGGFELGEAIEHPQIDIVGIGLRDLSCPEFGLIMIRVHLELLQFDRRSLTPGVFEYDFLRQL